MIYNKKLSLILILLILFISSPVFGENSGDMDEIDNVLSPFTKIIGTVNDKENGNYIADALIIIGDNELKSDDNGMFEIDPVLLGKYPIIVRAHHYKTFVDTIIATPPLTTIKVKLKKIKRRFFVHKNIKKITVSPKPELVHEIKYIFNAPEKKKVFSLKESKRVSKKMSSSNFRKKFIRRKKVVRKNDLNHGNSKKIVSKIDKLVKAKGEISHLERVSFKNGSTNLYGQVLDYKSGNPLEDVMIEIGPRIFQTDKNGKFKMKNIPVRVFSITFSKKGYKTKTIRKRLKRGSEYIKIRLRNI